MSKTLPLSRCLLWFLVDSQPDRKSEPLDNLSCNGRKMKLHKVTDYCLPGAIVEFPFFIHSNLGPVINKDWLETKGPIRNE